ncbi:MAG: hypothetical protein MUE81_14665 [Thermoflexibacter sp.]|jgi:hypothetical protein|nr:hypothetical protein [Thermoflexibacter sp.]
MPDFEDDYIHAEGEAHIVVNTENTGEFHFGYVSGYLRGEYIEKEGKKTFRFDWQGSGEMDEAHGTGFMILSKKEDKIKGKIKFAFGDTYQFEAKKSE